MTVVGLLVVPATLVYELLVYAKLTGDLPDAENGGSIRERCAAVTENAR